MMFSKITKGLAILVVSAYSMQPAFGCGYVCKWPVKLCSGVKRAVTFEKVDPSTSKIIWEPHPSLIGEDRNVVFAPEETTTYHFKIEGCDNEFSITIPVVNPMTESDAFTASDTLVCPGSEARLQVSVNDQAESVTWYTKEGHHLVGEGTTCIVSPTTSTIYVAEISDGACPNIELEMGVDVSTPPQIQDVSKENDRVVLVTGTGGVGDLQYSTNGTDFSSDALLHADANSANRYFVKDEMGCLTDTIFRAQLPKLVFPTVLTPNGDGVNDVFYVENLENSCPDAKVSIYDRHGSKLVEYAYSQYAWDGTYNGRPLRSDDYWYKVMLWDRYEPVTGHITLVRE